MEQGAAQGHHPQSGQKIRQQLSNSPPAPSEASSASPSEDANKEHLFLHMEYGQNDLPRKAVREIYDSTCREVFEEMGIKKFVIAYSRSNNIKELMTRAKLHQPPGHEASKYYTGEMAAEW